MKTFKFCKKLVPLVRAGLKTKTWRVGNDKPVSVGETILLQESGCVEPFARATVAYVNETSFENLTDEDCLGHEHFCSQTEMLDTYSAYYGFAMTPGTALTVIGFTLDFGGEDATREWLGHIAADLRNKLTPLMNVLALAEKADENDRASARAALDRILAIIDRDLSLLPVARTEQTCVAAQSDDGLLGRLQEENRKLRDLVCHAWVHAAYEKSGWLQMTSEQKKLFETVATQELARGD